MWHRSGRRPSRLARPEVAARAPQGDGQIDVLAAAANAQTGDRRMKKTAKKKGYIDRGETFDEFLDKDGLLAETEDAAVKRIIADQIKVAMDKQHLSKTKMAARMRTSRRQLDRLLDPNNPSVTLATLRRAASAVGRRLRVGLD